MAHVRDRPQSPCLCAVPLSSNFCEISFGAVAAHRFLAHVLFAVCSLAASFASVYVFYVDVKIRPHTHTSALARSLDSCCLHLSLPCNCNAPCSVPRPSRAVRTFAFMPSVRFVLHSSYRVEQRRRSCRAGLARSRRSRRPRRVRVTCTPDGGPLGGGGTPTSRCRVMRCIAHAQGQRNRSYEAGTAQGCACDHLEQTESVRH